MTDYTRWSEDRTSSGWSGAPDPTTRRGAGEQPYGSDGRQSGGPGYGYNPGDRYGGGDAPRREESRFSGRPSGRYDSGPDAYGIPSDYGYQGPEIQARGGPGRGYGAQGYQGEDPYRQERAEYGRGAYGQGYVRQGYGGQRYGGGSSQSYGDQYRTAGADHYPIDSQRAPEDRSFWSQARDEVAAWFGDEHATRRRQTDDLYFGEHRGKGPKGYTRSDERIRDDVNDRLTDHGHLDASDIELTVSGGEVTLNGAVTRREDKRRAEDLAEQVSGVKHVQNNLRVRDAALSAKSGSYGSATAGAAANQTPGQSSGLGPMKAN